MQDQCLEKGPGSQERCIPCLILCRELEAALIAASSSDSDGKGYGSGSSRLRAKLSLCFLVGRGTFTRPWQGS